jgi:lipopolysaccharide heptosyltransferase II
LRARNFDAAVIFTVCTQSPLPAALMTWLAGVPMVLAHCRENPYQLISHWVLDTESQPATRHEVQRQLDLVARVGADCRNRQLALRLPAAALLRARGLLAQAGMRDDTPRVVFHPGATAPSRRYPPEHFAAAAHQLHARTGCRIVFTGDAAEEDLVERIRADMDAPSASLVGRLDVAELSAVIALCDLLVVNNTGPAHIAAAVGTPVVDLYAQTNLQHTPWQADSRVLYHEVPCRGCLKSVCPQGHHDCLRQVAPERVVQAAEELLHWRGHVLGDERLRATPLRDALYGGFGN